MFVYGDSLQASLVGIIVPNMDFVKDFAQRHFIDEIDLNEIILREDF